MGTVSSFAQTLDLVGVFTKALDLSTPSESISINQSQTFTDGTGSNQIGEIWHDTRTITGSENLDLFGTLTNAFGETVSFAAVKILFIHNKATTTAFDLTLSGSFLENDLLGGTTPTIVLGPGGVCLLTSPMDGFDVTATTDDTLTVNSGANSVAYDILLAGTV